MASNGITQPEIIVFSWPGSPWASKVLSYLQLRRIPYSECHQPVTMPRPDLEALGINYRRVPVVAIGKDVYFDTSLILEKLEYNPSLVPTSSNTKSSIGARSGEQKALEKLLEKWTDLAVFPKAADCIPLDHPLVTDPAFIKDRTELWGDSWTREAREKKRPASVADMRGFFNFLEQTVLADGRKWVLGSNEPSLADIHAAWIFDWMISLEGSFPSDIISSSIQSKTYAWLDRFHKAVESVSAVPERSVLESAEALKHITSATFVESTGAVGAGEPLGLKAGQQVAINPKDTGSSGVQKGTLLSLNAEEAVISCSTPKGEELRIHTPRFNFDITAI